MKITYIGHSGFLAEGRNCYFLFDYYYGELPAMDAGKPVLVFASHGHRDHYNPEVFEKLKGQRMVQAVLSKDIDKRRVPDVACRFVGPWQKIVPMDGVLVETFHSTDKGVAFLITTEEAVLYHGGDLNDWVWEEDTLQEQKTMTGMYRKEMNRLKGRRVDLAFLPLDGRQEKYFDRGMAYFMETVQPQRAVPMHFWDHPEVIDAFRQKYPQYAGAVTALTENGQSMDI